MEKLLDNPDTMSKLDVIRALRIRHIYNLEDIQAMEVMTLIIYLGVSSLFGWIFFRSEIRSKIFKVWMLIIFTVVSLLISFRTLVGYNALGADSAFSGHDWDLQRLFYLCDGVVIIIAYLLGISYEAINVLLFGVIQPLLILILCIMVIFYQYKIKRLRQESSTTPLKNRIG